MEHRPSHAPPDDIDTMQHVDELKLIISRESPKWVLCDAGYGKAQIPDFHPLIPRNIVHFWTFAGAIMLGILYSVIFTFVYTMVQHRIPDYFRPQVSISEKPFC